MRKIADLVVVELEAHAVMDLVVPEGDVVLLDGIPLLDADLVGARAGLSGRQLLQVSDGVVVVALHPNLLPQPIVQHHLYHLRRRVIETGEFETLVLDFLFK